jgi:SAM-dependent methyltransferase
METVRRVDAGSVSRRLGSGLNSRDQTDYAFLSENARIGRALQLPTFSHIDQPIGIWNYIRIANDIARQAVGHVLDWGCGYGQMTYLLRQRGFQVTSFDVGAPDTIMPDIPICRNLAVVRSQHPTKLPFESASFDAVLGCGVLEHVDECSGQAGAERESLREIARVLRTGGQLLVYQLPQRDAWQETLIRRLQLGYSHPRRYTAGEIGQMLRAAGFEIVRLRRANLIPKNLTGMPVALRRIYSRFSRILIAGDGYLAQIPGVRRVAGVLEITARKMI